MTQRMLIDARHAEETRVAVLQGHRIEEFDFESAEHKQIKGNIYLAKVTRVEPSLQAAFVDFGGNRHGFLAFSEIHPDYYQIPREDREALLAEEAAQAEEEEALRVAEEADEDDRDDDDGDHDDGDESYHDHDDLGGVTEIDTSEKDEVATIEAGHVENGFEYGEDEQAEGETEASPDGQPRRQGRGRQGAGRGRSKEAEDLRNRRMALRRRYKIQDVIHRRQVLLVQVVKEERGNKGAALTTYLSLAGRYCVLMPNSSHGGGISRKISNASDRKRLKTIMGELNLPKSMGCIVRTAGLSRTKPEIKRDFDYLARLWDGIRENTLSASAPALIHSDSDLIKRAIRDIYNRDIEEVMVEGDHGYLAARDFMKLLMPTHVPKVRQYANPVPLFQRYGAEDQLTAMYDPVVQLKSGGYIVINPTEALVSIDINSGRSTKEYGIEATALNTNLEAAREIARQLRLRDMAGLVVIDFIDMEHGSNVRKVEKAVKDALKNDRARIQVGRISSFGLMEMSRQRLRTGVLEATTRTCPHCDGSGLVRTASSAGLSALRLIEDEAAKGRGSIISLFASTEAAVYLLNAKRPDLGEIELRYGVRVEVIPEGENEGAKMRVGSSGPRPEFVPVFTPIAEPEAFVDDDIVDEEDFEDDAEDSAADEEPRGTKGRGGESRAEAGADDGDGGKRKRRRRRRGRGRDENPAAPGDAEAIEGDEAEVGESSEAEVDEDAGSDADEGFETEAESVDGEAPRKRRRRGRRRRGRGRGDEAGSEGEADAASSDDADDAEGDAEPSPLPEADAILAPEVVAGADQAIAPAVIEEPVAEAAPKRSRRRKVAEPEAVPEVEPEAVPAVEAEAPAKPARSRRRKVDAAAEADTPAEAAPEAVAAEAVPVTTEAAAEPAEKPKRSRRKKADVEAAAPAPVAEADIPPAEPAKAAEASEASEASEGDDASAADEQDAENADGSPRRGWWQRTFGN